MCIPTLLMMTVPERRPHGGRISFWQNSRTGHPERRSCPEVIADTSDQALLLKLLEKPEMAQLLKALAKNL